MKSWAGRLAFGIALALAQRAWAGNAFEAVLVGANAVPGPGMTEGSFGAVVVVEGTRVTLTLSPGENRGWMAAHIHRGDAGITGRLVAEFQWTAGNGLPRTSVAEVSERVAADLVADPGKFYVDVHMPSFPAGAARGQLVPRASKEAPPGPPATVAGYDRRIAPAVGFVRFAPPTPLSMLMPQDPFWIWGDALPPRPGQGIGRPEGAGAVTGIVPPAPDAPPLSLPTARREQFIDFPEARPRVYWDPDFRLDASASSGLRVTFTASGDCTAYGATVHILSAGKCWVTASQPGDARFEPAPDVEQRIVIAKASQRIDGGAPAMKTYLDPDFPLDISATSGLAVVFFAWGDCKANGRYIHITGAGSCSLTGHQPGDSNYLAASIVDQRFTIAKADQTIDFPEFPALYYGLIDLPLYARATSELPVGFSLQGPCEIVGDMLRLLDTGECSVTANQPGDRNFNPAPPVKRTLQILAPSKFL